MTKVIFTDQSDKSLAEWQGEAGLSLMQIAQEAGLDIEGACEGNMACATCHLIISADFYDKLPAPSDDEEEMLDFVPFLTSRSRLSCQILVTDALDGLRVQLPKESVNLM